MAIMDDAAAVSTVCPPLTRQQAIILAVLLSREGRVVTFDAISEAHRLAVGAYLSDAAIRTAIKRTRVSIAKCGIPVVIHAHPGVGWRAETADGWESPLAVTEPSRD